MNLIDAIHDEHLFRKWFTRGDWAAWWCFVKATFGLPMSADDLVGFTMCTERSSPPTSPAREAWLICGRRAGKSYMLAIIAVYLACFKSWIDHLAPGERATVLIIAQDRRQARVIFRYVRALLLECPILATMVEKERAESFDLTNRVTIEICSASFRSVRGYSIAAALCDELAFWPSDDSTNPDFEVLDALRPGMANMPESMLLCASSPHTKRGALYDAFRKHYGKDGDVLVWKADTRTMNPSIPQAVIDAAMERDPDKYAAEYGAHFRNDLQSYIDLQQIERCVEWDCRERPPERGIRYFGFCDPSGGQNDSMCLGIAHKEKGTPDRVITDLLREAVPPFRPDDVVRDFAMACEPYRVRRLIGDKYAGSWVVDPFRKRGIEYVPGARPKSELYQALLPLINQRSISLLDHPRLINQLANLERRCTRGGKDSIDHAPNSHDDLSNVIAGVAWCALGMDRKGTTGVGFIKGLCY